MIEHILHVSAAGTLLFEIARYYENLAFYDEEHYMLLFGTLLVLKRHIITKNCRRCVMSYLRPFHLNSLHSPDAQWGQDLGAADAAPSPAVNSHLLMTVKWWLWRCWSFNTIWTVCLFQQGSIQNSVNFLHQKVSWGIQQLPPFSPIDSLKKHQWTYTITSNQISLQL